MTTSSRDEYRRTRPPLVFLDIGLQFTLSGLVDMGDFTPESGGFEDTKATLDLLVVNGFVAPVDGVDDRFRLTASGLGHGLNIPECMRPGFSWPTSILY